jgi:hypothetical protein
MLIQSSEIPKYFSLFPLNFFNSNSNIVFCCAEPLSHSSGIYINILVVGCCEEVKKYEIAEGENGAEKMLKGVSLGMF